MKLPDRRVCRLTCRKGKWRKPEQPTAHGEVPSEAFSDGGSTPPASTRKKTRHFICLVFSYDKTGVEPGAEVNDAAVRRQSRAVTEPAGKKRLSPPPPRRRKLHLLAATLLFHKQVAAALCSAAASFRKRSHLLRLFGCKRPHNASASLPIICGSCRDRVFFSFSVGIVDY